MQFIKPMKNFSPRHQKKPTWTPMPTASSSKSHFTLATLRNNRSKPVPMDNA